MVVGESVLGVLLCRGGEGKGAAWWFWPAPAPHDSASTSGNVFVAVIDLGHGAYCVEFPLTIHQPWTLPPSPLHFPPSTYTSTSSSSPSYTHHLVFPHFLFCSGLLPLTRQVYKPSRRCSLYQHLPTVSTNNTSSFLSSLSDTAQFSWVALLSICLQRNETMKVMKHLVFAGKLMSTFPFMQCFSYFFFSLYNTVSLTVFIYLFFSYYFCTFFHVTFFPFVLPWFSFSFSSPYFSLSVLSLFYSLSWIIYLFLGKYWERVKFWFKFFSHIYFYFIFYTVLYFLLLIHLDSIILFTV